MYIIANAYYALRRIAASMVRLPILWVKYPHVKMYGGVSIGKRCRFGDGVSIFSGCTIAGATIGSHSYVGGNSVLKHCIVGKFCSIAPNVQIGLGIHPTNMISAYPGFYSPSASGSVRIAVQEKVMETMPVIIGNDVWIGNNAIVLDGINVGNGAIIAAGAVVTADVAPYCIVAGVPARVIRQRFTEREVAFLEHFRWWDKGLDFCKLNASLFSDPAAFFGTFMSGADEKSNEAP